MPAELRAPIRAVLFDVDGTLYSQGPLRAAMACEMAVGWIPEMWRRGPNRLRLMLVFRRMREELRSTDSEGEPLVHRQYTAVSKRLNCPTAEVEQAVDEWIHRRPLKWLRFCRRSGIDELLLFLRARDVRCGVFSDYPAADKVAALGLGDRFDLMMSAVDEEVGAFKPDPQGFRVASARWGIPTEHILYVGDRFEVDAVGAASAGMPCAVLTSRRGPVDAAFIAVSCFQELQRVLDPVC